MAPRRSASVIAAPVAAVPDPCGRGFSLALVMAAKEASIAVHGFYAPAHRAGVFRPGAGTAGEHSSKILRRPRNKNHSSRVLGAWPPAPHNPPHGGHLWKPWQLRPGLHLVSARSMMSDLSERAPRMQVVWCVKCGALMDPEERHPFLPLPDKFVVKFRCPKCDFESWRSDRSETAPFGSQRPSRL